MKLILVVPIILVILVAGCTQKLSDIQTADKASNMKITSPAFENNGNIPAKYTCDGQDTSPPMEIEGVPPSAKSIVLIIDDPDAPGGVWVHGIAFNIDPQITSIEESSGPKSGVPGKNSWGKNNYGGPCPPSGTHRYFFKLYALDKKLELDSSATKEDVEKAMEGHILARAELIGKYSKK